MIDYLLRICVSKVADAILRADRATRPMQQKPVRLRPNHNKILEAILFIIEEAGRRGEQVTQYDIVKSLFVADLFHLKKFGRPVTFDNYSALEFGPVPREAYEMLKSSYPGDRYFGVDWPLWDRVPSPEDGAKAFKFQNPRRPANLRRLSKTDANELSEALTIVKRLGFGKMRDWTHLHPAYVDAWQRRGDKRSKEMDYAKLLDEEDRELLADLAHASKYV